MPHATLDQPRQAPARDDDAQIPPLAHGDRLDAVEFRRRYEAMPEDLRAELIGGIVYLHMSPVSHRRHGKPHLRMGGWLIAYELMTPGLEYGDNATVRLGDDDEPQPDLLLMLPADADGAAVIDDDDYVAGAPELVVEIANSSAHFDLNAKMEAYRGAGVREYVVWNVPARAIDWFVLGNGAYARQEPTDGTLTSRVFPGLRLDVEAMLRGDNRAVREGVVAGVAAEAEAHAQLVKRLSSAAAGGGD